MEIVLRKEQKGDNNDRVYVLITKPCAGGVKIQAFGGDWTAFQESGIYSLTPEMSPFTYVVRNGVAVSAFSREVRAILRLHKRLGFRVAFCEDVPDNIGYILDLMVAIDDKEVLHSAKLPNPDPDKTNAVPNVEARKQSRAAWLEF